MENVSVITQNECAEHLKYEQLIPAIKNALEEYSKDRAAQPLRTAVEVKKWNGILLTMPSYCKHMDALATKMVTLYPDNQRNALPSHQGAIVLFDSSNGSPLAILDAEVITAMRTAAASTVATQAIISVVPKVLAILGSGVQAESHVMALSHVYKFDEIRIWSRNAENAVKLCTKLVLPNMKPCDSAEKAVKDADIVVTATTATSPILFGKWLKPGCHINCVGACRPDWREVDDDCLKRSTIYADSAESAQNESGDIVASQAEVYAEIGELLLGKKSVRSADFTFFKSLGLGMEDAVAAKLVFSNIKNRQKSNVRQ